MNWGEVFQGILMTAVQLLVPVLIGYVIVYINAAKKRLEVSMGAENFQMAQMIASTLVNAAEQTFPKEQREEKLNWVIERMEAALLERGIVMDLDAIVDLIEASVRTSIKSKE